MNYHVWPPTFKKNLFKVNAWYNGSILTEITLPINPSNILLND